MIYRSNETLSLSMPTKISAFNVSSRLTLFSITDEPDELAVIDFVGLSMCSPLSDEADFETTLSLLVVEKKHQKNLERLLMTFPGVSVFDVFFLSSDL